jgi:hypothetical protein
MTWGISEQNNFSNLLRSQSHPVFGPYRTRWLWYARVLAVLGKAPGDGATPNNKAPIRTKHRLVFDIFWFSPRKSCTFFLARSWASLATLFNLEVVDEPL